MSRFERIDRQGDNEIARRSGPSKKWMEEDLRRAVERTAGKLVAEPAPAQAKPADELRAVKPATPTPPAPKQALTPNAIRYVEPVTFKGKRSPIRSAAPKLRMADPTVLRIEPQYQRDLSKKSLKLIEKIVAGWDWAKFKPPVCAQTPEGLFVIDGQHTAIAAATHPDVREIPILIVDAAEIERRAEAFVAHNRDRLVMTPAQILLGEAAAGNGDAAAVMAAVKRGGGSIPRSPIGKQHAKPGQIVAIGDVRAIYKSHGGDTLERIVRIAVTSGHAPTSLTMLRAIRSVVTGDFAKTSDSKIAGALASFKDFEHAAQKRAGELGLGTYRFAGGAALLAERLRAPR